VTNRAPLTDRRVALRTAAVAALALPVLPALAGCDATDEVPRTGKQRQTAGASPGDRALVQSVAVRIASLHAAATAAAKRDKAHRSWLLDLASLHQQHLHRLGATDARPQRSGRGTTARVVAGEQQLKSFLLGAADGAESGALAQVLASMAAAVAQRLAVA